MTADPGISTEPRGSVTNITSTPILYSARDVVWIGIAFGLLAGFGDMAIMIVRKRWTDPDFYRVGDFFPWILPLTVLLLVLIPAFLIGIVVWRLQSVRPVFPVLLLAFFSSIDTFARFPLELWACALICAGLSLQCGRWAGRRPARFLVLVRGSVWVLIATLLSAMLVTIGGRAWSESARRAVLPTASSGAPNVLLVVWDTVRAANTSLHRYPRATTPNLDKLATQGVSFDRAFATSSWTLPSHASMFTGRWPHELGVNWKTPMRADVPTIAEHLAARGYDTAGFVANLDYCSRETGVARGFLHYEDFPLSLFDAFIRYSAIGRRVDRVSWRFRIDSLLERWGGARAARWHEWIPGSREHLKNAEEINHAFLTWLDRKPPTPRPFFAFLNMNDAHSPYEIPDPRTPSLGKRPETATDREILQQFTGIDKMQLSTDHVRMLIDVYDDSVSYLDRQLGSLIDQLGRRGLLENTLLIIASDHGEHLGDHGLFFHGNSLYRQSVQVPLVIVGKSNGVPVGRTVAETVGLNDLPATMVDLLKLPGRAPFPGRSLRQYWDPRPPGASLVPDPILMETTRPVFLTNDGREPAAKGPMKSIIAGGMHYIQLADGTEQLFKISDVDENENLLFQPDTEPVLLQFRNLLGLMLQKR